jgi:TPR repeat protein
VKPRRSQQATRGRGGLYLLWPILAIMGAVVGHLPSSTPSYEPSEGAAPTHVSYQQASPAPQLPPPPTNDPYLMDIDALRQSAERGNPTAQSYLGVRYEEGNGVAKSAHDAAYWYRLAAERGFPEAQFRLGELYKKGSGVPQNNPLALEWWEKAANKGHALAQNSLGEAYAKGEGVQKDYQAARRWWQGAAFNNNADAEVGLGWLYANGYGIPRDAKTAVDWFRKAAAQGDVAGQVDLALMFDRGEGVPADPVIADALLTVATEHQSVYAQGGPGWADLDRISAHFTPAQQSAASQIARDLSTSPGNFLAILDTAIRFRHRMQ